MTKRSLLILIGCDLALYLLAVLAIVLSPPLRVTGIVGLGIAAVLTVALVLAVRRSRTATRARTLPRPDSPSVADLDEATSLRNQPSWRDDVNGRVGPKW
jgi:hypothetical protein